MTEEPRIAGNEGNEREWGAWQDGHEFDWYAVDNAGRVGAFCTAGVGPVPAIVFDVSWKVFLEFEAYLDGFVPAPSKTAWYEPFKSGGLFAYDYEQGPWYSQFMAPEVALMLEQVPPHLQIAIANVRFSGDFRKVQAIKAENHWPCKTRPGWRPE